jgi:hypothetical protein
MRKSTRRELAMLRDLAHSLLPKMRCKICRQFLMEEHPRYSFGDRTSIPVEVKLAAHHLDHDHSNGSFANRAWVHDSCHRRYHNQRRQK